VVIHALVPLVQSSVSLEQVIQYLRPCGAFIENDRTVIDTKVERFNLQ